MKAEIIQSLTTDFESHAKQTENGVECWLARDLQHLLGYEKWDNFKSVLAKAKIACEVAGHAVLDHFAGAGKMVTLGSGSRREVPDMMLSRNDGNGRVVRLPMNYILVRLDFLPMVLDDRDQYIAAIQFADTGDIGRLEELFANRIAAMLEKGIYARDHLIALNENDA